MTRGRQFLISNVDYARLEPLIRDGVMSSGVPRDLLNALKSKIDSARVLDPVDMPKDIVTMNSLVRVRDLDTEEIEAYTLVYPAFAETAKRFLSIVTPVGIALLGARQGETVECVSSSCPIRFRVEKVEFQPESAGQYDV